MHTYLPIHLSSLLSFTVQPIPVLGRVDLAAVFFHRKKFEEEDMYFGNQRIYDWLIDWLIDW